MNSLETNTYIKIFLLFREKKKWCLSPKQLYKFLSEYFFFRLIRHFHALNIPIAVATSSSTSTLAEKTKNHRELFDLFHHVVTGSHPDLKNGKPAPDIFLLCASMFDPVPDPAQCLVFEDAPNGIQAACDSGMQSVMVPHQSLGSQYTLRATQVIHSLIDFKPSDFGLPAFR